MTCEPTDRLLQTLRVRTPGAPDPMLQLELFNIMDEFFRRTSAWQQESPIELIEGQMDYPIPTPPNATVVRVLWAKHNDLPVQPAGSSAVASQSSLGILDGQLQPDGDSIIDFSLSDINASNIFSWALYRPDYLTITGVSGQDVVAYPFLAQIALSVARSCLDADCGDWDVPEWMWDMYFQEWLDGTQARLYGMMAKPWSNQTLAAYHAKRFRDRMGYRKQEIMKGFTWGQPGWRFPKGGWV